MMIFFLFPLVVVLLSAVFIKYLLQFIFRSAGWQKGVTLVLDDRLGSILLLCCSAIAAGILYWYPAYVARRNAAPDDRFGFFFVGAFPYYVLGAGLCGLAMVKLAITVVPTRCSLREIFLLICGVLLALIGSSPFLLEMKFFWFK